jgi:polysaccharide deacetylase
MRSSIPLFFLLSLLLIISMLGFGPVWAQTFDQQMSVVSDGYTTPNMTNLNKPAVILTFDDDWPGQYWYVRPILQKYDANATFFISCTAVGDVIREEQPQFMMSWKEISQLHNDSFDIQSHGLTHADLTEIPLNQAEEEIGQSKECIMDHIPGLRENNPITIYANAFAKGGDDKKIVDLVAKYYDFARTGYSNTTYLGCDGWYAEEKHEPPDCRVTTPNGTVKYEHRYQLHTSSHNELDKALEHNTTAILADFKNFLNQTIKFNDDGTIKAMPIIAYHNIAYLNQTQPQWYNSTTLPETLAAEVQYMNQSGIRMLSMADLEYDNATQKFHIRGG